MIITYIRDVAFVGADIFQRLADAEQHILELHSRILGLTALNAELTKKLTDEVTETTVMKALDARNTELQAQLTAANKEITGLQVCQCKEILKSCIKPLTQDSIMRDACPQDVWHADRSLRSGLFGTG